jgi:hypothetical protein
MNCPLRHDGSKCGHRRRPVHGDRLSMVGIDGRGEHIARLEAGTERSAADE